MRLTARTGALGDRTFVRMGVEFDPGLVSSETTDSLLDEEAARAEVENLARRWDGWAFEISGYTLKNLQKKVEDMVKPVAEEATGSAPDALPAPAPDTGQESG